MTDIETVRLLIGDRIKPATWELVDKSMDGLQKRFQLDCYPLASAPLNTLVIYSSGVTAATANYTLSGDVGYITFTSAMTAGAELRADYRYHALTSGELTDILSGLTGQPYMAAANAALILAADTSRLFAYTMGDKTVDKRKVSQNLRDLADSLLERHNEMYKKTNYTGTVMTCRDDTGTPFYGFDTAVAYLTSTT